MADLLNHITEETMKHAPSILATVIAVENAVGGSVPGETKAQIVIDSVLAGAQAAGTSPNVTVQSIAALTSLFVSILNSTDLFKRKSPKV